MKRFDKGYIYSGLLTDLFYSIFLVFAFLNDILIGEEADSGNLGAAMGGILLYRECRLPLGIRFILR